MDTINHKLVNHVTRLEAIAFCQTNRDKFIELAGDAKDGLLEFNELINLLENGEITAKDLPEYCMSDQELSDNESS